MTPEQYRAEIEKRFTDYLHTTTKMKPTRCYDMARDMAKLAAKVYEVAKAIDAADA
jgi:hypothetical protein